MKKIVILASIVAAVVVSAASVNARSSIERSAAFNGERFFATPSFSGQ